MRVDLRPNGLAYAKIMFIPNCGSEHKEEMMESERVI